MNLQEKLNGIIREVQDFPKEGIVFKDLSTYTTIPRIVQ